MLRRVIIAAIALLLASPLQAYQFTRFNTNNSGISYDGISCFLQDSRGFMWIGTYKGLNRYDGFNFYVYDAKALGLPVDFIHCLVEDTRGNIWVGTDAGVSVYNYSLDRFEPLLDSSDRGSVIHNKVTFLSCTNDGTVHLLVNNQGYFSYNVNSREFTNVSYEESGAYGARRMLIRDDGSMLVSRFHVNLYKADARMKNIRSVGLPGNDYKGDEIERIFQKDSTSVYIASAKLGLSVANFKTGEVKVLFSLPEDTVLVDAFRDSDGSFWLSTPKGAWVYSPDSGMGSCISSDYSDSFSLSSSYVTCTYVDRSGGLWIGTLENGVNYSGKFQEKIEKQYLAAGRSLYGCGVSGFAEDGAGRIWVATQNSGLFVYDSQAHTTVPFNTGLKSVTVCSLCIDGDWLWGGTFNGLCRIDTRTGRVKDYGILQRSSGRNDPRVYILYRTVDGDLFAGTTLGLFKYDRGDDAFREVDAFDGVFITSIDEDGTGRLWLSSFANGLFSWDYQLGSRPVNYRYGDTSGLPSDKLSSVFLDASGQVWTIGFSSGIARFSQADQKFKVYDKSSHKAFPSNVFFKAVSDDNGRMWLASDSGLILFDPRTEETRVYTGFDGLMDTKLKKSCLRSKSGDMYFGSDNGFIRFNPSNLSSTSGQTHVALTKLRIGPRNITVDSNIDLMDRLEFKPDERSFGFALAFLGQDYLSSPHVQSRLTGFDDDWKDIPQSRSIYYYNVPPGEYTLEFRTSSFQNTWEPARKALAIIVRKPFWQTPPGIILIILALLVLMLLGSLGMRALDRRERMKKEQEYRKAKEDELYQEKLNFFSHVIHEIKTPLTLIKAPLTSVMSKEGLDEDVRRDLDVMNNSTGYMSKLVNELLDFVRIEKNGYALNPEPVDLVERLNAMVFDYSETARTANLKLTFSSSVQNAWVSADQAALNKILNNLLLNAVQYAESFVEVKLESSGDTVSVEFSNDGQVIPDEYREDIFKPFMQYHDDARVYANGVGIGLPLSRNLAAMHSGTLVLDPRKDITLFRLTLPALVEGSTDIKTHQESQSVTEPDRACILIADDNKDLTDYLASKLSEYEVIAVGNGDTALQLLEEKNVDLLVSDISMPGKSGLELCREIRSDIEISHLPIIIVSARASVESKIQAMEAGADLYIEKPFDMEYLRSSIRNILDRRSLMKNAFSSGRIGTDVELFGLPKKDEEFFARFDGLVKENLDNAELSNDFLAEKLNMSTSTLTRKIRKLLNTSPNNYIRVTRLSIAAQMLRNSHGNNISEISYAVGFSNVSYFAKCFKEQYGVTPTEYNK